MSIIRYSDIRQYWSNNILEEPSASKYTTSHNKRVFTYILCVVLVDLSSKDPLWRSHSMSEQLLSKKSVNIATHTGPSTLDEPCTATKA
jgi:hypothetical protein